MGLLFPKITLTDFWSRKGGALPSVRSRRKTKLPRKQLTLLLTSWIEDFHGLSLSWVLGHKSPKAGWSCWQCAEGMPFPGTFLSPGKAEWSGRISLTCGVCGMAEGSRGSTIWLGLQWVIPGPRVLYKVEQARSMFYYTSWSPVRGECCMCGHEVCEIYMLVIINSHSWILRAVIFYLFICYYF